ncbi:hypothetical protein LINPERHAP1_LOCUS6411, partial [Linum perenne]
CRSSIQSLSPWKNSLTNLCGSSLTQVHTRSILAMTLFIIAYLEFRCMARYPLWMLELGTVSGLSLFPPKLQFFIWKCILGILPTRVALSTRIKDIVRLCPGCAYTDETVSHLLLFCQLAVRFGAMMNIPLQTILSSNFCIVWRRVTQLPPPMGKRIIFFWWRIWKSRNQVVFHSKLTLLPGLKAQMEAHIAKSELDLDPDDVPHCPPPRQVVLPLHDGGLRQEVDSKLMLMGRFVGHTVVLSVSFFGMRLVPFFSRGVGHYHTSRMFLRSKP